MLKSPIRSPMSSAIRSVFEPSRGPMVIPDPLLSSPVVTVINETSANASVTSNRGDGVLYWVATTSATQPTTTQIKAGQNNVGAAAPASGSQAVSISGVQSVFGGVIGLTQGTTYYVHFYLETDALEPSNIITSASFVPADVTAPVLSSAEGTQTGSTTANLTVNTDTAAGTLYWVATTSATTPSAAQIIASQNHLGAASVGASRAVSATGPQAFGITGLTGGTTYWAHFVHRDVALNTSNTITVSASFTTTSETYYYEAFHDGSTAPALGGANSTMGGNYADSLGGGNAVLWSADGLGPATAEGVFLVVNATFANSITRIRCRFRVVNKAASKMWLRVRPINVTSTDITHIDITDDATPNGSRVGTTDAPWGGTVSVVALGGGWFQFQADYNATGDADRSGTMTFQMASVNNTSGIVNNVVESNQIAVHDLTFEQL